VRRSPFAANPAVGVRGLRTQQQILDASLLVFREHGFDRATLNQIGKKAGAGVLAVSGRRPRRVRQWVGFLAVAHVQTMPADLLRADVSVV